MPQTTTRTLVRVTDFVPNSTRSMEKFYLQLVASLRERGWRTIHVFAGEPAPYFQQALRELDSPYFCVDSLLDWQSSREIARHLRSYPVDILEVNFISKFSVPLWWLKKAVNARRLVVVDHSSGAVSGGSPVMRSYRKMRGGLASRYMDQVITVSDFVRRRDIEQTYLRPEKILTAYNGVDTGKYKPGRPIDSPSPVFTVACAGQLIPEKGFMTLLRAVERLANEPDLPPFRVQIAGAGHQATALHEFCTSHNLQQVQFLGQIDWIPRLFASADVVVVPSEWEEAFGFVAAEAMACGTPVITSDAGGLPEVVGDTGFPFPKGDAQKLADVLRSVLTRPAQLAPMRRAARERVLSHFTLERMVEQHAKILMAVSASTGAH